MLIYDTSSGSTSGSISLSGNGTLSLSAASNGPDAGVLIYQSAANTKALSFSGNAMAGLAGTVDAPAAQLVLSGNANLKDTLIVDTLSISGNAVAQLAAASGGTAYTPAQIRTAYGINNLSLDGTGQTIAIVDAYDDPQIYQALDAFDGQFGLTTSGPTLYQQYGPATSFLTVLNQNGQPTSLPGTDPVGPGQRQLGSRGVAGRGVGPCHRPRGQDHPRRGQQPVAGRLDGRRGHRRQPAGRIDGFHELGLRRRPGCTRAPTKPPMTARLPSPA